MTQVFSTPKYKSPRKSDLELRNYAKKICGTYVDSCGESPVSSRGIFAVLTMLDLVQDAPEFVDAGVNDLDLPLRRYRGEFNGRKIKSMFSSPSKASNIVQHWSETNFDSFMHDQQFMISPYLNITKGEVPYHQLHQEAVLPFIGFNKKPHEGSLNGLHGHVSRVRIHPAHHNYKSHAVNHYFFNSI